jgi:hypothetical protein
MTKRDRLFILNDPFQMRVSKELAKEIGLKESIVLLQIDFLLANTQYVREDKPWIRMTLDEMKSQYFDFIGRETLRRALESLQKSELITIANFNRAGFDRTQWITLNVEGCSRLRSLTITRYEPSAAPLANSGDGNGPITQNGSAQVTATLPLDDPDLLTPVDDSSTSSISQNEPSRAQNGTSTRANREIEDPDRDVEDAQSGNASSQNEPTIRGRDLEKRLTSSGRDALRPEPPKKINVGALLAEVIPVGATISRRFKGHLGREMNNLVREGVPADVVRDAAKACIEKGLNPHNLPSLALEVRAPGRQPHQTFATPDQSEYEDAEIR